MATREKAKPFFTGLVTSKPSLLIESSAKRPQRYYRHCRLDLKVLSGLSTKNTVKVLGRNGQDLRTQLSSPSESHFLLKCSDRHSDAISIGTSARKDGCIEILLEMYPVTSLYSRARLGATIFHSCCMKICPTVVAINPAHPPFTALEASAPPHTNEDFLTA